MKLLGCFFKESKLELYDGPFHEYENTTYLQNRLCKIAWQTIER